MSIVHTGIYTECGVRGSGIFSGSGPKHEAEDESNIINIFLYLKFDHLHQNNIPVYIPAYSA